MRGTLQMLYASTWNSLTKSLGSTHFTDSLFATTKAELTAEGYAAHRAHMAAPKPMTPQEREAAEIREAERKAGNDYQGSRARVNHVGKAVGLSWEDEAEKAVANLGSGSASRVVILVGILLLERLRIPERAMG
jgi:twinfilin